MRLPTRPVLASFVLCFLFPLESTAQSGNPWADKAALDRATSAMFDVRSFQQASVSPDARRVAWVESLAGKGRQPSTNSVILVADLSSPEKPWRLTAGHGKSDHEEHDLSWSRNGKRIAFLSDAGSPGQLQLFIADANSGNLKQLTQLKGFLASPAWAPQDQAIALLVTENATRAAGPLVAETPDEGVVSEDLHEQRFGLRVFVQVPIQDGKVMHRLQRVGMIRA